ncbi:energy transducer TonB [Flavobacterium endoglycinae]|uniref:Energy transducer TonB n=1 Tax=Flavobacterium endoglycinae TaxID=2816357 RepID=A0ABX7Q983_9FLAO|nr:energy transducer TonB [Flavobacterium endoglycinae]QSW87575.1 energy transducer TonB [Flavobacterium endoglycinae]
MSKSSIYENNWTNIVFENKNKEYGAYQLRQENSKTSVTALFTGLLLIAGIGSASMLISKLRIQDPPSEPAIISCPITPVTLPDLVKPKQKEPEPIIPAQQSAPAAASIATQLTNPVVSHADEAVPEIATNTNNVTPSDNPVGNGLVVNAIPTTGGSGTEGPETVVEPNKPIPTAALDKLPEFPGGMKKFYTYVGNNFTKPELDAERTLRVYVSFVIEKDGTMTDIVVKNDPGYGLGKEAIRVLKSLKTKWVPGILDGQPVRTAYNLPITIQTE